MTPPKNVLSRDVTIVGKLKFSQDFIIDGEIDGEINSDGNLVVGEAARIKGEIRTKSVTVMGKVDGNITVEDLCALKGTAIVTGDIIAQRLSLEEGAQFCGQSKVGKAAVAAATGASAPASAPSSPSAPPRPVMAGN